MEIRDVELNERSGEVTITALIDDMILIAPATWEQPAEYGAALCVTSFFQEDVDFDVNDRNVLEDYLKNAQWFIINDDE